jgi:UDP-glucose 4-epimerase
MDLATHAGNANVKKFIFLSTIKVNGENNSKELPFNYYDSPNPQDYYSISKWKAEIELWKLSSITSLKFVIIRPPLVYGPNVGGNFLKLLNMIYYFPIFPNIKKQELRSYVSVDNLVSFIIHTIKHPNSANKTFLISDDHDISFQSLIKILSKKMNKKVYFYTIPNFLINFFCKFKKCKNLISKLFFSMKMNTFYNYDLLGWKPVYSLDEELTKMVKWYLGKKNYDKKN